MKNRTELTQYFADLGFRKGAEIGTCYGFFAARLHETIPGLTLFAVDNWDNPETERREKRHNSPTVEEQCRERLSVYGTIIVKKSSVEASKFINDGQLDFVYIDAGHDYENVKADIEAWTPKVRKGGIVSGDDYYEFRSGKGGVIPAVNEYVAKYGYELNLTEWDNENPLQDERQPQWYFTK